MRRFFTMTVRNNDGTHSSRILDRAGLLLHLKHSRDAINRIDPPTFTLAGALRDIMDEQALEITYGTYKVIYEILPHYTRVRKTGNAFGISNIYEIVD